MRSQILFIALAVSIGASRTTANELKMSETPVVSTNNGLYSSIAITAFPPSTLLTSVGGDYSALAAILTSSTTHCMNCTNNNTIAASRSARISSATYAPPVRPTESAPPVRPTESAAGAEPTATGVSDLTPGAKIGIGCGCGAGAALILGGFFLRLRQGRKKRRRAGEAKNEKDLGTNSPGVLSREPVRNERERFSPEGAPEIVQIRHDSWTGR